MVGEVIVLDDEGEDGVGFGESVKDVNQIARMVRSGAGEEVAEGLGEEAG